MIWCGPILSGVVRQFYEQGLWSDLDVLLIDLPPGTSDAAQRPAVAGGRRRRARHDAAGVGHDDRLESGEPRAPPEQAVLGVVENTSYSVAPDTGKRYDVFGPSYADDVADLAQVPVIARLPIDPCVIGTGRFPAASRRSTTRSVTTSRVPSWALWTRSRKTQDAISLI
jgi:hypothetical protein